MMSDSKQSASGSAPVRPARGGPRQGSGGVHPIYSPRQTRLRRRINNFFVYRTIRKAIRDCRVQGPVLAAPCGYGWFFDRFRRDGIEVVGVDISPEALAFARTAVNPPMQVFEGDIQQLPFSDGQFEFIVSNRFLLHFEDDFRALAFKELARVTRKYLLVHYDTPSVHEWLRRLRGFRKPDLDLDEQRGWRKRKRKTRRLFYDGDRMAAEGAAAGLNLKKLYYVFHLLSARAYCLYEKADAR